MAIEITPEIETVVQDICASGHYANEREVITTALILLQQRDRLRRDLAEGVAELDRGERLGAGQVFAELRQQAQRLDSQGA